MSVPITPPILQRSPLLSSDSCQQLTLPLFRCRQCTHLGLRQEGSGQTHQLPLSHRQTPSSLSQLTVQSTCRDQDQQSSASPAQGPRQLHQSKVFPVAQKIQLCSGPGLRNWSLYT